VLPNGKRDFYEVNKKGNMKFDYDVSALEVSIEPGVNYEVQKQIALKMITSLMNVSDSFKQFMNQNGLEVLLDNIDIRGIDRLRYSVQEWMQQQKAMAMQAQQQQANQPTPEQVAMAQVQVQGQQVQVEREGNQLKAQVELAKSNARNAVDNKEADIKFLEVMSNIQDTNLNNQLKQEELDAENARTAIDMSTKLSEHFMKVETHQANKQKASDNEIGQNLDIGE